MISVLAGKFGQPALAAGNDVPALISSDQLKVLFLQFKKSLHLFGNIIHCIQHTIVLTSASDDLPEFATLASIALVIPVSSVPCEHGFTLQNHVKTCQRSRLLDHGGTGLQFTPGWRISFWGYQEVQWTEAEKLSSLLHHDWIQSLYWVILALFWY